MPLCFNVFGYLPKEPKTVELLRTILSIDIVHLDSIECEVAPLATDHLQDRTAFDAFIVFRDSLGERCFVGIETKYTDSFSPTVYSSDIYDEITERTGFFRHGAAEVLRGRKTNQLWRMALLRRACSRRMTAATREGSSGF